MAEVEEAPGGIRDEATFQRPRVASQLLVHAGKDLLLHGVLPGNRDASVRFIPGLLEKDGAAGIVLSHNEVKHGVIQGAVRILQHIGWVEIAKQALKLR